MFPKDRRPANENNVANSEAEYDRRNRRPSILDEMLEVAWPFLLAAFAVILFSLFVVGIGCLAFAAMSLRG